MKIDPRLPIAWPEQQRRRWRRGQIHCLEGVIQTNPWRILEAMRLCSAESAREQRHDYESRRGPEA